MITAEQINTLTRACLKASEGHMLAVCDYSSVEARALAWMAGDTPAVDRFRKGEDAYKALASRLYNIPTDQVDKPKRQIGKIGELACLAGDTLVLTDRGPRPITSICVYDRLWDGVEWVSHGGLVPRGIRETVEWSGVRATAEHRVWCGGATWYPFASLARSGNIRSQALGIASARSPSQATCAHPPAGSCTSSCAANAAPLNTACLITTCAREPLRGATHVQRRPPGDGPSTFGSTPQSFPTMRTGEDCSIGSLRSCSVAGTPEHSNGRTTVAAGSECLRRGAPTERGSWRIWLPSKAGIAPSSNSIDGKTIGVTCPVICASLPSDETKPTAETCKVYNGGSTNLRHVFDIAHAGPRNRFAIVTDRGLLIVHNCGYGMGAGGEKCPHRGKNFGKPYGFYGAGVKGGVDWPAMAKARPVLTPKIVVDTWRAMHAPSVQLWKDLEHGMKLAYSGEDNTVGIGCVVHWSRWNDAIVCTLPSGRALIYHDVHASKGKYGIELNYVGGKGREKTYGGKITENIIQAICRDFLAVALVKSEDAGLMPVLHVHDEIVCDVPKDQAAEGLALLEHLMKELPPWGAGMPIGAEGFLCERYRK